MVTETLSAVRAYAAIVGRVPQQTRPTITTAEPTWLSAEPTITHAEQLHAAGEYRAAARQWRRLAEHHALRHGHDDPDVFGFRLNAARAHVALGERSRALRQFREVLRDRTRAEGPDHPAVRELHQEIARLSEEQPPPPRLSRYSSGVDH